MKKQIMGLIAGGGEVTINNLATLKRWTRDAIGNKVDCLELRVKPMQGIEFSKAIEIKSRDYSGIIAEVATGIEKAFAEIGQEIAKQIKNGHGNISAIRPIKEA